MSSVVEYWIADPSMAGFPSTGDPHSSLDGGAGSHLDDDWGYLQFRTPPKRYYVYIYITQWSTRSFGFLFGRPFLPIETDTLGTATMKTYMKTRRKTARGKNEGTTKKHENVANPEMAWCILHLCHSCCCPKSSRQEDAW